MRIITIILCLYFLINCIVYIVKRIAGSKYYEESILKASADLKEDNLNRLDILYFIVVFFLGLPILISSFFKCSQK